MYSRLSGDSEMVVGVNGDLLLLVKPHLYFPVHPSTSLYKFHHQMVSARFHVDIHVFFVLVFFVCDHGDLHAPQAVYFKKV